MAEFCRTTARLARFDLGQGAWRTVNCLNRKERTERRAACFSFGPPLPTLYYNDETSRTVGKNLECGDLSPPLRFGDLSPKQGRVQRPVRVGCLPAFDGDKAP